MYCQRTVCILLVALLFATSFESRAEEKPAVLASIVTQEPVRTVIGEVGRENDSHIEVFDLSNGQSQIFKKAELKTIRKDVTERVAVESVGLPNYMAWRIKKLLPISSASGKIAQIDGATIYTSIGSSTGVEAGIELVVYRGATEIKDPDTGEVLGKQRRKIAKLEIISVEGKLTKAKMVGDLETALSVGDVVEPAVVSNSVAIFPLVNDQGAETIGTKRLAEELVNGLVNRGVSVIERRLLTKVLGELGLQQGGAFDPAKAQKVGKQLGAYAVVIGTVAPKNKYIEAQLRLVRVETGEILAAVSQVIRDSTTAIPSVSGPDPKSTFLDGEWVFSHGWLNDKVMSGDLVANNRIIIRESRYHKFVGTMAIEGRLVIDPSQSPMQLDWIPEKGGTAKLHGKTTPGIFELLDGGNTLRFCCSGSQGARPVEFDSKPQGWSIQIYKKRTSAN